LIDQLNKPEVRAFIKAHENDDPASLVLQSAQYPNLPIKLIAAQIKARKKAKSKIPEFYQQKGIIYPPGVSLEQSSSEQTAKYKAQLTSGKSITDLTGGFGIDTYYFAKNGTAVNYVEQNEDLCRLAVHNFDQLGIKNVRVFNESAAVFLNKTNAKIDWYYLDPARRNETNQKVFRIADCSPDLRQIVPGLIGLHANILIKLSPMLDIGMALNQLTNVREVHVVSVDNECKELLFWIDPAFDGEPLIVCANVRGVDVDMFQFAVSQESETQAELSLPEKYLYEPNASIMKAGGMNSIALKYALKKLHRNSHLYTTSKPVDNFPGRGFKIIASTVLNKKKLQPYLPDWKANITIRNYPNAVNEIRAKTGLKDGGDVYLFATTLMDGSPKVLICEKVGF